MSHRWLAFALAVLGGALSANARGSDPAVDSRAMGQVSVMVWDQPPGCIVRQSSEEVGHKVPCKDVGGYLRDAMHLGRGALVRLDVGGKVTVVAVASVSNELSRLGFKVEEGFRVGFMSEPGIENRAVAVVTTSEKSLVCRVRRNLQEPGRQIPCEKVGRYLLEDLGVPCGAFVMQTNEGQFNREAYQALFSGMSAEEFESAGSVGVIRRCGGDR
jgi:hypothetical protein